MVELALVFVGGALGSSHCLGMCGPFALALGSGATTWTSNLRRQATYTLGRVFTYAFLGAAAGYGGARLTEQMPAVLNGAAVLAMLAGVFLIYQGLKSLGWLPFQSRPAQGFCLAAGAIAPLLRAGGGQPRREVTVLRDVFLAGLFTGLLPCGLVYAFLALAAGSQSVALGAATMTAFGLGTAPLMIATGCGGAVLRGAARQRVFQVAALCVVLTGFVTIGRGLGYFEIPGWRTAPGCPLCEQAEK